MTQPELAYLIGVHETTIRRWETDNKGQPRIEEVQKLAEALHVTVDDLLNDNNNNQSWVLSVSIGNIGQEVIDLAKPTSIIMTSSEGGFLQLGGNYELWTDDNSFKKLIADLKRLRSSVIQNGIALGAVKK